MKTVSIPDNATNGEAMKAIYPNVDVIAEENENMEIVSYIMKMDDEIVFSAEWWNAPYKTKED